MKYIGQYSSPEDIATLDNVRSVEILATDASNLADSAKNALAEHVDDTNIHVTLAEKTTWNGKQDKITGAATGNGLFFGGGFKLLIAQLIGVVAVGAFTFVVALIAWLALKATMGIRVSREEEIRGLDLGEHGMEAYAGFQVFLNQ